MAMKKKGNHEANSNVAFDSWPIELNRTKLSIKAAPGDRKSKGDCLFQTWVIISLTSVFFRWMFVWAE